ncbi:MAG: hypothetical protein EOS37_11255 [Mesorhizobium sp.]|nr:MAG: hypothetical protein EOS37_11255 [Mesorhizobium sp.]
MAEIWPGWPVVKSEGGDAALWSGTLRPNATTYQVDVFYKPPSLLQNVSVRRAQPRVYVRKPQLVRRPGDPEGIIPHVYWPKGDPEAGDPSLCLFDPEGKEWSTDDYLAETTIPWSALWLNWYEGWLVTGKWLGSGRHENHGGAVEPKSADT